jgi:hypothetical protein
MRSWVLVIHGEGSFEGNILFENLNQCWANINFCDIWPKKTIYQYQTFFKISNLNIQVGHHSFRVFI